MATETLLHRFDDVEVKKIAFSTDGRLLAGTYKNFIRLFDMEDFEEKTGIEEISRKEVMSINFSPDSSRLAAGIGGGLVHVWDVKSHQNLYSTFQGNEKECSEKYEVLFFPNVNMLAGGSCEGGLKVWDLENGENTLSQVSSLQRLKHIINIAISSDGAYLAFGNTSGKTIVFDTKTWKWIEDFSGYSLKEDIPVSTITFWPGSSILAGNKQNDLLFLGYRNRKRIREDQNEAT